MRGLVAGTIALTLAWGIAGASAQDTKITKTDTQIDALDPGIKLFLRRKMAEGNTQFADNVILFLHGATGPSTDARARDGRGGCEECSAQPLVSGGTRY
jgi:hypothetical protein